MYIATKLPNIYTQKNTFHLMFMHLLIPNSIFWEQLYLIISLISLHS